MSPPRILVVGGGAAGLMAAGQAAKAGAEVIILEKMKRPGRKLRITGKGRCNLTNSADINEFLKHFRAGGRFLRQAFNEFFSSDLIAFLEELGVQVELERGGRYFPKDNRAEDVVDAMVAWVKNLGVRTYTNAPVEKLSIKDKCIVGVRTAEKNFESDRVIIATGGASYPATGSTGNGYFLAESAGHTIIPIRPSLVPVETSGDVAQRIQGLKLKNINAVLFIDGKKEDEQFGELLFTESGLSGPIILSLSRKIVNALSIGRKVAVSIDLKPALEEKKLDARLLRDFKTFGKRQFRTLLKELLPNDLIPICIELTDIPAEKSGNNITAAERKRLRLWLKDFEFEVSGHRGFNEALITAGGVSTREIDPRTMQSRLIKNLYLAGEVLDIDADTGGFNLQAAFSTGWLAGRSATQIA